MKKKLITYLSYGSLILGAAIGIYVLLNIYIIKSKLPPGTCAVIRNRPYLYVAIALCCISFVLSFFETKVKKEKYQ